MFFASQLIVLLPIRLSAMAVVCADIKLLKVSPVASTLAILLVELGYHFFTFLFILASLLVDLCKNISHYVVLMIFFSMKMTFF